MAEKPETRFARNVHKYVQPELPENLDDVIHMEHTNNPVRSGTPDFYIEGPGNLIWVEYKFIKIPWTTSKAPHQICNTKSWTHQLKWLNRSHRHGVQTATIVGFTKNRVSFGYILRHPFAFDPEKHKPIPVKDIGAWINSMVT